MSDFEKWIEENKVTTIFDHTPITFIPFGQLYRYIEGKILVDKEDLDKLVDCGEYEHLDYQWWIEVEPILKKLGYDSIIKKRCEK